MLDDAIDVREAASKFYQHRARAKARGIEFVLAFDEWLLIWWQSGHYQQMGKSAGKYVMARTGDVGAYALGNVRIAPMEENLAERKRTPLSDTATAKIRASKLGNDHGVSAATESERRQVMLLRGALRRHFSRAIHK